MGAARALWLKPRARSHHALLTQYVRAPARQQRLKRKAHVVIGFCRRINQRKALVAITARLIQGAQRGGDKIIAFHRNLGPDGADMNPDLTIRQQRDGVLQTAHQL